MRTTCFLAETAGRAWHLKPHIASLCAKAEECEKALRAAGGIVDTEWRDHALTDIVAAHVQYRQFEKALAVAKAVNDPYDKARALADMVIRYLLRRYEGAEKPVCCVPAPT